MAAVASFTVVTKNAATVNKAQTFARDKVVGIEVNPDNSSYTNIYYKDPSRLQRDTYVVNALKAAVDAAFA